VDGGARSTGHGAMRPGKRRRMEARD